jgi:hypothetical protein
MPERFLLRQVLPEPADIALARNGWRPAADHGARAAEPPKYRASVTCND